MKKEQMNHYLGTTKLRLIEAMQKIDENAKGILFIVDENGHLMGALGSAILAKKSGIKKEFNFKVRDAKFETAGCVCNGCPNHCEIIIVKKNNKILDAWGNRCSKGAIKIRE